MIVHQLVADDGKTVTARCGATEPRERALNASFSAFDSRVTCVHCKPSLRLPGPSGKKIRILRRKK